MGGVKEYDFISDELLTASKVILDAGANIGAFSVYATLKSNAYILSVEPENDNFSLLTRNTQKYGLVKPLHFGIWSHSASLQIVQSETGYWGYTVEECGTGDICALSINDIIVEYNIDKIDILKVDIEGSEIEMLSGDCLWLEKVEYIIIETHDRKRLGCTSFIEEKLAKFGFVLKGIFGEDRVYIKGDN